MNKTRDNDIDRALPVIGIPRALYFYKYAAMWVTFLEEMGARVLISCPTNRKILDDGLKSSVDESCLPTKVYLGHVQNLISLKPDFIFVCRQQDFSAEEVLCTKFWGLPDICRNTFDLPAGTRWLELNISPSVDGITDYKGWRKVGRVFTSNPFQIRRAYRKAEAAQKLFTEWLQAGKNPMDALQLARDGSSPANESRDVSITDADQIRIALLGHSYLIHDEHIGLPVLRLLHKLGVTVHIVEDLDTDLCRSRGRALSPNLYWTFNREIVGAADYFLNDGVDGAILVEAFPCGPDALVFDYLTRTLRGRAPIVRLVMDELQALTGIQTRLESFIDIIRMRREEVANA